MTRYDYKVIPAPSKGQKARGVKTPEARFAFALEQAINALAADGWEYVRAETLPSEERQGLTGTATAFRNVLIFRKPLESDDDAPRDEGPTALLEAPDEEPAEPDTSYETSADSEEAAVDAPSEETASEDSTSESDEATDDTDSSRS